jgi:hypothetical protein
LPISTPFECRSRASPTSMRRSLHSLSCAFAHAVRPRCLIAWQSRGSSRCAMSSAAAGGLCPPDRRLFWTMLFPTCIAASRNRQAAKTGTAMRWFAWSISFPSPRYSSRFMLGKLPRLHFLAKSALCRAVSRG